MSKEFHLRTIYGQVILGVSPAKIRGSNAHIRHPSPLEQGELDSEYALFLATALERGLHSEEDRLKSLEGDGLWTPKQEGDFLSIIDMINGLKASKRHLALASQVEQVNAQIEEETKKYNKLLSERADLIGLTAETFARKKLNERYIFQSLFANKACTEPLFSEEDYDYLDMDELNAVAFQFNEVMKSFGHENLKKISLQSFFQDSYGLCDDKVYHFYGKPIIQLTFYQADLINFGRFFRPIIYGEQKPPAAIMSDPDKIIDWFQAGKNAEKMISAHTSSNVAVMDATKDDLAAISEQKPEAVTFQGMAKGKTSVRGAEFMKMLQ